MPGGGIEPPTRGFLIETAINNLFNTMIYMLIFISVQKSVYLIFYQFGSNTVSPTNGGTQCLSVINANACAQTFYPVVPNQQRPSASRPPHVQRLE